MPSKLFRRVAAAGAAIILAFSQLAIASAAPYFPPGAMYYIDEKNGWCGYDRWGGIFRCQYDHAYVVLPNGKYQVFVIGQGGKTYTKWETATGVSEWLWLDYGKCVWDDEYKMMEVLDHKGWALNATCIGTDHRRYYDHRYENGHWSGWTTHRINDRPEASAAPRGRGPISTRSASRHHQQPMTAD